MKIGYSELFDEEHDGGGDNSGGLYISPSVGVSLPVTKKTSIHVGIGYTYNQAKYEFSYIPGTGSMGRNNTRFNAGGLTLSVGVSF
jgi:opacity protein-like surface antigen